MITAKQLAEELLKNPDDIVCTSTSNVMEQGQSIVLLTSIRRFTGVAENRPFTDAFDHTPYTHTIIVLKEHGTNYVKV